MDHGAARSRKQANLAKLDPAQFAPKPRKEQPQKSSASTSTAAPGPSRFKPKVIDNTDPARFRPKAIRDSVALIWSQGGFDLPPSSETISKVTRVDLTGSPCTDISWLAGTNVTWLSLKGCRIEKGWEEVGALENLAVLNISDTDLKSLPKSFRNLTKLKALVAMNLPWHALDDEIVGQWSQLNSLIISHSPNLTALPRSLGHLTQLSKLTCSHCPRLSAGRIPDLSDLPLLRDVKMNNLALVDVVPSHMAKWGTGRLPANEHTSASRQGDGLEVLDLGNCSLPFSAVEAAFLSKNWSHLRSLSLHSNPLAISHPDYATLLQDSETLPKLQIIDSKRIVQRKRKGEIQESKIERRRREKKEKKRMTGANARETTGTVRVWGGSGEQPTSKSAADGIKLDQAAGTANTSDAATDDVVLKSDQKRKRKVDATTLAAPNPDATAPIASLEVDATPPTEKKRKRVKSAKKEVGNAQHNVNDTLSTTRDETKSSKSIIPSASNLPDPSTQRPKRKVDDGKVELVAKSAGGVDLTKVFGKPPKKDDDGGLGVGGW